MPFGRLGADIKSCRGIAGIDLTSCADGAR